jgi:pyruvate/2-oxoglutarate dehydrogenase complex dihydrolipoamide acyltransferase (E2) component
VLPELADDQRELLAKVSDGAELPADEATAMQLGAFKRFGLLEHQRDAEGDHWTLTDRGQEALDAGTGKPKASKEAQAKADELGVDLATVAGTGSGGKATVADVKAAHEAASTGTGTEGD